MEFIFLIFGIISLLLIIDGQALRKQERIRPLLKQFRLEKDSEKTRFIAGSLQAAGAVTLVWTIAGFFLYDLLIIPIFIIIYFILLGLVAAISWLVWYYRKKETR